MGIVGRVWDYFLAMLQIATLVTLDDQAVLQVPGHPLSVINTPFWSVLLKTAVWNICFPMHFSSKFVRPLSRDVPLYQSCSIFTLFKRALSLKIDIRLA